MAEIISFIINHLKNTVSKEMICFIISLMPILELRGGMIAASILNVPFKNAVFYCVLGNIIPIPFILIFLNKIFDMLEKNVHTKKLVLYFKNKADKHKAQIEKYGYLGLILFVGIPLPGTGAWTGSLVASILKLDIKKSFICILIGIILALIIMSIISYGVIGNIIR